MTAVAFCIKSQGVVVALVVYSLKHLCEVDLFFKVMLILLMDKLKQSKFSDLSKIDHT